MRDLICGAHREMSASTKVLTLVLVEEGGWRRARDSMLLMEEELRSVERMKEPFQEHTININSEESWKLHTTMPVEPIKAAVAMPACAG